MASSKPAGAKALALSVHKDTKTHAHEMTEKWQQDQLDPDNWLEIPDFGVMPADVDFKGFANPIVTPNSRDLDIADSVRTLVRVARSLARQEFSSLAELQQASARAWKRVFNDSPHVDFPELPDRAEKTAFLYQLAMGNLSALLNPPEYVSAAMRLGHVASKGALIADWAHRGAIEAVAAAIKAAPFTRQQGAKAKKPKTLLYEQYAERFPRNNKGAVDQIRLDAPNPDDGKSPFYWRGRELIDRETGRPIRVDTMTAQLQKARQRAQKGN